ncbi:phage integrase family protein [Burkholderia pseudomallei MSHR4032]|uniref:tyrosine-type recombinase/integrase n=1 Tax=Burkholderia pseudomallei TaxID=28450 RepID=UPI0005365FF7|nr:site-specific integrase [Burkholderia pseudomallei]KGV03099.1 phage integrase family protein [Burkholderia pseudomallei MSHR4032]KGW87773.1 phage integrase family protein [Burkholderia pseudomallei MSHR332]
MDAKSAFRAVLIRPRKEFGSLQDAYLLSGLDVPLSVSPRYFDVPLVAIVVDRHGQPVWEPTLYLADCALRGRSFMGDTVRSYAEALVAWLSFLADVKVELREVSEDVFARFRVSVVHHPSPAIGRTYASSTANHRISVVSGFYLWGQLRGGMRTPLGAFLKTREDERRGYSRLRALNRRGKNGSLAPAVIARLPRLLSLEEIRRIFQVTPSPYRLMLKWALLTGLRRFEICNLTLEQLPSPEQLSVSQDGFARINVVRKGTREVTLYVPVRLVEETQWYVLTERPTPLSKDARQIFIGRRGSAIDRASLSKVFRKHADGIGTDATLHHLRHTFAVNVLSMLEQRSSDGDSLNSIKTLQVLMGHASLESTEIYLRAMDVSSDAVMQALDYLYGATL